MVGALPLGALRRICMDGMRCPTTDRTRAALGGLRDGRASGTTDLRGVTEALPEALPDLGGRALRRT